MPVLPLMHAGTSNDKTQALLFCLSAESLPSTKRLAVMSSARQAT